MSISLEKFATKLMAKNQFVKASFGGFAGSGKTRTASEFIVGCYKDLKVEKPLLIIDNEKGSRFLVPFFKNAGIDVYVKDTTALADVIEAMSLLNRSEIGFLYIDSLSKVWYQYVRDYQKANNKKMMYLQDWGKVMPAWQESFSDKFVSLDGNCVFTGRGGFSYEMEEDESGKKSYVKSGVKMKLAGETPFEPDLNVWMEMEQDLKDGKLIQWREAQILKDRSGTIDGKTFKNPTYKNFQPMIQYLTSVPTGNVAGQSSTQNLAPREDGSFFDNQRMKAIEIEKFWAEFDWMGQTANEKKMKNEIFKKFTGTTRKTEFENSTLAQLTNVRKDVEKFMSQFRSLSEEIDPALFIKEYGVSEEEEPENAEVFNIENPLNV